jgi:NADH:ubiquinone oxidoreductase subunit
MSVLLRLTSPFTGRKVGTDRFGNVYFESKKPFMRYGRTRRWVVYAGAAEATSVPPEWHAWIHHTTPEALPEQKRHPWMLDHQPNATGTAQAWRPSGHDYAGGRRPRSAGDYEAWTPGS